MKVPFLIIVIVVFILYIIGFRKYADSLTILQANASTLHPNILFEKLPVIVYDKIVNPIELIHTIFKYQFAFIKHIPSMSKPNVKSMICILHAKKNTNVLLKHPKYTTIIECKLDKHNIFIIPYGWVIPNISNNKSCDIYICDTIFSKVLSFINI